MSLLKEIESIRTQVQQRRVAVKLDGAAAAQHTRERALQQLEAQLDNLWQGVHSRSIDEPTAAGQLDALFLDYVRVAMGDNNE